MYHFATCKNLSDNGFCKLLLLLSSYISISDSALISSWNIQAFSICLHMDINSLDSFRVSTKSSGVNWTSAFCHFHVKYLFGCVDADILSCSWTTLYCKLNLLCSGDTMNAIWCLLPLATWYSSRWRDLHQRKYLNTCMLKLSFSGWSHFKAQRNLTDSFSGFCLGILDNFP